jgi:hypothetical protein
MLPGFRFLLAAMVLSVSILVFGLGAAALLRAAHEEVASNPSWRAAPETIFAPPGETKRPVLAMLRVEPGPAEPKAPADLPAIGEPVEEIIAPTLAEQAAISSPPAESREIAALKTDEATPPEAATPDMPLVKSPASSEATPPQTDAATAADEPKIAASNAAETTRIETPAAEAKVVVPTGQVAVEPVSPPTEAAAVVPAPAATEQINAPVSPQTDATSTRIATLGSPPDATKTPAKVKAKSEKPDDSVIKKRQQARRAAHRRQLAARARQARLVTQQPAAPFVQPFAQPATPARTR